MNKYEIKIVKIDDLRLGPSSEIHKIDGLWEPFSSFVDPHRLELYLVLRCLNVAFESA